MENKYQESFVTMCKNLKKRKTTTNKNKVLSDLSQMMKMLGLEYKLIDEKNLSGKSMIAYKNIDFKYLVIADYNVRDIMYLKCRQKINDQTYNSKKQILNLSFIMIVTLLIATIGIIIVFTLGKNNIFATIIGVLIILFSLLFPRMQDVFNASKSAALFCLIEVAKNLMDFPIGICFLNETGNEQGMIHLEKEYPELPKIYINQLGKEENLYVLVKNKSIYSKLNTCETNIYKLELLENDQDTIIRQFKNGILISTCDFNDMSCIMPGTPNDDVSNLGKIDDILHVISQIVK